MGSSPGLGLDGMEQIAKAAEHLFRLWLASDARGKAAMIEQAFLLDTKHGRMISARFLVKIEGHYRTARRTSWRRWL